MDAILRTFRAGDGPALADAWTRSAPGDGVTYDRFRDLVLLDRNFDPHGLLVAEKDGRLVGAVYAVRRLIAAEGADLEPDSGWIPFFFVVPEARRAGIARGLMTRALEWLREQGVSRVFFSSYTPNYFLPGLDEERYPEAAAFLRTMGFETQYRAVAMDRTLNDYAMPESVRERIERLRGEGWRFFSPEGDDLVDLIDIAGSRFNADWSRGIREGVLGGQALERIMVCRDPEGTMLGWAMHGTYENVLERFGPFGVLPESRGNGLGEILLHLTLERMRALGAHSAWFLWTDEESPAGRLYLKTGFSVTRTFTIMHTTLDA
ncbi:GNAT family N-acetyltransferase [Microbacterium resistens]|uniref:GNAT family N-acetyltransferase n=1 Tax=Microbacterium resistens TaxID=156977 RepID=UPI0008349CA1|nr:GNAT family N-acetyltransferase [Microbacterium resistens]